MPEIILRGPETFTATCCRCGCHFRYTLDELRRYTQYSQGTVACPQCGTDHEHPRQEHGCRQWGASSRGLKTWGES